MVKRKYKVEFKQTETFIIDLYAKNEKQARELAEKKWEQGDYQEVGDCSVEIDMVYDVSGTDDPFNP
jgi:hypothetical protein